MYNQNAMFRKTGLNTEQWETRYFEVVRGPWQREVNSSCALTVDINQDGLDDLIVCGRGGTEQAHGLFYQQTSTGEFLPNPWINQFTQRDWRNARVGDFTGNGRLDLAVVYGGDSSSYLRIFKGLDQRPWFDFRPEFVYYQRTLPFAAPDLEAMDFDNDGVMDLYIVQADERRFEANGAPRTPETYCAGKFNPQTWWPKNQTSPMTPPMNYVPPPDEAPDLVLLSRPNQVPLFQEVQMNHRLPGCGFFVKKFGDRSLVLAQGGFDRPGEQFLLQF